MSAAVRRRTTRKPRTDAGGKGDQARVTDYFNTRKLPSAETAKRCKLDPTEVEAMEPQCVSVVKQEAPCSQTSLNATTDTVTAAQQKRSTAADVGTLQLQETPEVQVGTTSADISPRKRKSARALLFDDEAKPISSAKRQLRFPVVPAPIPSAANDLLHQELPTADTLLPQKLTFPKEGLQLPVLSNAEKERLKTKLRSVAGLQERLAKTSEAARRLRDQQTQHKSNEVDQLKARLSPVKVAPKTTHDKLFTFTEPELPTKDYSSIARLIPQVKDASQLKLPSHFSLLATMFHDVDQVVSVMRTYNELITFDKVQRSVRSKLKRDFELKHLGQIKSVYSESYNLSMDKKKDKFGQRSRQDQFDLILTPNLANDILGYLKPESPKKLDAALIATPTPLTPTKLISPLKGRPFLSPSILFRPSPRKSPQKTPVKAGTTTDNESPLEEQLKGWRINCRSQIFVYRLVNLVKKAHREFLKQLHPAQELSASDEALLRRWHPDFKLDSVPEVPVAALPEPPETIVRKKHMKDYLDHPSVQLPAKVDEVLGLLKSPEKHKVMGTMGTVDASAKPKDPFLARLERIRQKEREKKMAEMMRNPVEEQRRGRLERLKSSMVRSMCSYYALKKCTSLPMDDLVEKLAYSYGAIPKKEVENHLLLLAEIAPDIATVLPIAGKGKYVRLLVNDFNRIQESVDNELKKLFK